MKARERAQEILRSVGTRRTLREDEAKGVLKCYGIPTTSYSVVRGPEDLKSLEIRFPAVLKLCSDRVLHKTELGGVRLNIGSMDELDAELAGMRSKFPNERFLVEPMERGNLELIVGLFRDETFGLVIMVGMGGIFTELYRDVNFRTVPIDDNDAREMIQELKIWEIFRGFRGIKADLESTLDILSKVSSLGDEMGQYIDQMDLNPLVVREKDAVVVDAKLILKGDEPLPA